MWPGATNTKHRMTKRSKVSSLAVAIAAAYMLAAPAHAQGTDVRAELEGLKLRLSQQSEMLENLQRAVADQEQRAAFTPTRPPSPSVSRDDWPPRAAQT